MRDLLKFKVYSERQIFKKPFMAIILLRPQTEEKIKNFMPNWTRIYYGKPISIAYWKLLNVLHYIVAFLTKWICFY